MDFGFTPNTRFMANGEDCSIVVDTYVNDSMDICVCHKEDERGYVIDLSAEDAFRLRDFLNSYYGKD